MRISGIVTWAAWPFNRGPCSDNETLNQRTFRNWKSRCRGQMSILSSSSSSSWLLSSFFPAVVFTRLLRGAAAAAAAAAALHHFDFKKPKRLSEVLASALRTLWLLEILTRLGSADRWPTNLGNYYNQLGHTNLSKGYVSLSTTANWHPSLGHNY